MLLLLFLAGCDAVNPTDPIQLSGELAELRYSFTVDENGNLVDASYQSRAVAEEVTGFLDERGGGGFSKSEIIGAEITSAEIQLTSPPEASLNDFNWIAVQVGDGNASFEVASREEISEDSRVLSLEIDRKDIASQLQTSTAEIILQLGPQQLEAGETYVIFLTLDVRMELEGV